MGWTSVATDNFNTAADPLASPWAASTGANGTLRAYQDRCVKSASGATNWAEYYSGTFNADQYAEVTPFNPGNDWDGPAVRMSTTEATLTGYLLAIRNTTTLKFYKVSGTTRTQLGSSITLGTALTNDVSKVRLRVQGTTLTASVDGSDVGNTTDNTYSSGQPGIIVGAGSVFDNFEAGHYVSEETPVASTSANLLMLGVG